MGRMVEDTAVIRAIRTALRADTDGMADVLCKGIETVVFKYVPTIDVAPVRHGHWIGGEIGKCSVCGHKGCSSDIWNDGNVMFCPHCGARMDGKDGEQV